MNNLAKKIDMETENRHHERKNLRYDSIPGKFLIEIGDDKLPFNQVNDVSISGMGILLDQNIPENSQVRISYNSPEFSVSIAAQIIWCDRLSENVYRMGIQFSSDNMDDNVMLFMTLREYIDDFGEAF